MESNDSTLTQEDREQRIRNGLPVELVVIRHAEPDWESARLIRDGNPGLTDRGRRTARVLAEHLREKQFAAIICSPLQRARETAAPIAKVQQIEPVVVEDLAEIGVPLQGNVSQAEVDAYFRSAAIRPFNQHWAGFPGGESFRAFHQRVTAAITAMLKPYGVHQREVDGFEVWSAPTRPNTLRLAMIAHGGTNGVALTHLLGISPVPWEWIRFETPLAAYSVLSLRPINDEGHVWSLQQFGRRVE
jgi:broad specificity phosphatase PhoE